MNNPSAEKFRRLTNPATVDDYGLSMGLDELREAAKTDARAAAMAEFTDDCARENEMIGVVISGMARNARDTLTRIALNTLRADPPNE